MTTPIPIDRARALAEKIAAELAPFCEQIEIAGSIRRERPFVNDLDFVILPKQGSREAACRRILQDPRTQVIQQGQQNLLVRLANGIQLDFFLAKRPEKDLLQTKPTNFGSLLLCRTGSRAHNIHLIEIAKKTGHTWNPYYGVFDPRGKCLASETEQEIFHALQLDFIQPKDRE